MLALLQEIYQDLKNDGFSLSIAASLEYFGIYYRLSKVNKDELIATWRIFERTPEMSDQEFMAVIKDGIEDMKKIIVAKIESLK